jgi:restriction system protein
MWYLTPEGESALKMSPEEVMEKGEVAYREWRKLNPREDKHDEEPMDDNAERDRAEELNMLESDAREGIRKFIVSKSPYEFQDMVAALLRAMDYHTPFIAPKGKDGGVDIIAYLDPLGAKTPRIKVQVKHKPNNPISNTEINSLSGLLRAGDIGLFVTSGSFSKQAVNAAQTANTYIKLIDGKDFIKLWREYYSKMSDEDKNRIPLKFIAFIGSND